MDTIEQVVSLYQSGLSAAKVGRELGLGTDRVYYILKKSGTRRRSNKTNSRKYFLDDAYFSVLDTPEKAYWLGFLYADGAIVKFNGQSVLKVDLNQKDMHHLEKLRDDLQATYKIGCFDQQTTYGVCPVARLQITSDLLVDDLINLGCTERKTFSLSPPAISEPEFIRSFIRGFVDGDGSIAKSAVPDGYRLKITGPKALLEWMNINLPRAGGIYPTGNVFSLESHADNIIWLYDSATRYLDRKHERYQEVLDNRRARNVLPSSGRSR
jgi:hypothetical protein